MLFKKLIHDIKKRPNDWLFFIVSFILFILGVTSVVDTVFIPFREDVVKFSDYALRIAAFITIIFFSISYYKHFKEKKIDRLKISVSFSTYSILLLAFTEYGFGVAIFSIIIAVLLYIMSVSDFRKICIYLVSMLFSVILIIILQYNDFFVRDKVKERTFDAYTSTLNTICIIMLLLSGIVLVTLLKSRNQSNKSIEKLKNNIEEKDKALKQQVHLICSDNKLTSREKELLLLYASGATYDEIEDEFKIKIATIKSHNNNITLKIGRNQFEGIKQNGMEIRRFKNFSDN